MREQPCAGDTVGGLGGDVVGHPGGDADGDVDALALARRVPRRHSPAARTLARRAQMRGLRICEEMRRFFPHTVS